MTSCPLLCGWAIAWGQLLSFMPGHSSALGQKAFLLARMATNRALLESCGDRYLSDHTVLKDKHDAISFVPVSSFWVSGSPRLV